jgi:glycosyltransferase involved in cell wall biosynthesis
MANSTLSPKDGDSQTALPNCESSPTVGILLCTYNGAPYLRGQIDSILAQTHKQWNLFVSDDGSTDETVAILNEYQAALGARMTVVEGPKMGFAQNFMSLVRSEIQCDYYAFSDQDDIWLPEKLARSVSALSAFDSEAPSLYCSRTQLVDKKGNSMGFTPLFSKPPAFKNALVQSLAGANTMVINHKARTLLAQTRKDRSIVAHDWLAYLVVSGCGGSIVYDAEPTLLYRQHDSNLIGANDGIRNRMRRFSETLGGRFKEWNEKNLNILKDATLDLTPENHDILIAFDRLRNENIWKRLCLLQQTKLYRQTMFGTLSLYAAVLLNRI